MSEYTSTREGFQRVMEWSLTGPPEEAQAFCEATSTPDFYHVMNDKRSDLKEYTQAVADVRRRATDYKPVVHEFLRDGDQLAARTTGTLTMDGNKSKFESFIFGKVERVSGKIEYMIERIIFEPAG